MEALELTAEQAARINGDLRPASKYLADLQRRMEERPFCGSERLYLGCGQHEIRCSSCAKELQALGRENPNPPAADELER